MGPNVTQLFQERPFLQANIYVFNSSQNTGNFQIKDYYLEWIPTGPSFGQVDKDYVNKSVKSGTIYFKDQLLRS